jgi:hypothetical protein
MEFPALVFESNFLIGVISGSVNMYKKYENLLPLRFGNHDKIALTNIRVWAMSDT